MNVKLMLDTTKYSKKPSGFDIVKIQGYTSKKDGVYHAPLLSQKETDIEDLAIGLCNGMTCKPALLNGSKSNDWMQQQVFMLDFDLLINQIRLHLIALEYFLVVMVKNQFNQIMILESMLMRL
ncbi:hypothetical protein [Anaerosporobacter sp.]